MADKIALIDFCETIADFQTLIPYLQYVVAQEHPRRSRVLSSKVVRKCCALLALTMRIFGRKYPIYKKLLIWQLKGISKEELEEHGKRYYTERISGHLIEPTMELISELKEQKYHLVIVSGGSDLYISRFVQEYGIDDVLSAQFGYDNGVCNGKLLRECMGDEKTEMLRTYMRTHGITGEIAIGISDSQSDLPMLELCQRKIVISSGQHQAWVRDDMEEIIWGQRQE